MLPSGNDASLALGVWGGKQLISNDIRNNINKSRETVGTDSSPIPDKKYLKKDYISRFLEEMNKKA